MGACSSSGGKVDDQHKNQAITEVNDEGFSTPPFTRCMNPRNSLINLDESAGRSDIKIEGKSYEYDMSYCYVSQKGYYPNALGKANQDSYLVLENLMDDSNAHLFGVFDGHGETGDYCSYYAAESFSMCLAKELRAAGGTKAMDSNNMNKIYTQAFLKSNKSLKTSSIDDSLSGTTAISVFLKGDKLYVGNVGDSRAIIASVDDKGKLKYSPLSSDQTPFRKDERERLKLRGAQIFTIDQIDGHEPIHENWGNDLGETGDEIDDAACDPPRVWDKTLEKPGCAFTRSIGDSVAETIGVFAEPEILTWDMQPHDKFAVVASDGVFEFLPNQTVVDMIAEYNGDYLEAAKHVVSEAYRLWLENDERTDDITIIIVDFKNIRAKDGVVVKTLSPRNVIPAAKEQAKPVRKVMNKQRRKDISENFDTTDDIEFDFAANATTKTKEEVDRVAQMVKSNFMFQHLPASQREQLFTVMKLRSVVANEMIIIEGDNGDEMYIIDEGEFNVLKNNAEGISNLVFTYTTLGAAFGELSLMYGKPRAASIQAKTDGKLWVLGRQAFRAVLMKKSPVGLLNLYRCIPILKNVSVPKLHRLAQKCNVEEYKNEDVISKHDPASTDTEADNAAATTTATSTDGIDRDWIVGVVVSGSVSVATIESDDVTKSPRAHSREEGSYIVRSEIGQSISTITAEGRTKIAFITKKNFLELIGKEALDALEQSSLVPKHRGKATRRKYSFLSNPENISCPRSNSTRKDINIDMAMQLVGDFGYIATLNSKDENIGTYSGKIIFKKKAEKSRNDARLLLERQILTGLAGKCPSIASIYSTFQDERIAIFNYSEVYLCDLGLAIYQNAISDENKTYYSACLCSALFALHEIGVMHRFINPGSIYINSNGLPKIAELRYAKKFDGQKAYTICGDPLYFAPELVKQQGYDYGVDLWALGCVIFELYEGMAIMGTADTEETQLFKKINSFEPDQLEFSRYSHKKVRSVITNLMDPEVSRRCGYRTHDDLKSKKMFSKIDWDMIGTNADRFEFELISTIEMEMLPPEMNLDECTTNEFFEKI
jgi:serine/threonine protein phosphatase PrpC/serine/threonine protein kinase